MNPTLSTVRVCLLLLGWADDLAAQFVEIQSPGEAQFLSRIRQLTFVGRRSGEGYFSPGGKKLCWTSNRTRDAQSQLFLADWDHPAALAALKASPRRGAVTSVVPALRHQEATAPGSPKSVSPGHAGGYAPEIRVEDLRREVDYLASDALEGRLTGTKGAEL